MLKVSDIEKAMVVIEKNNIKVLENSII